MGSRSARRTKDDLSEGAYPNRRPVSRGTYWGHVTACPIRLERGRLRPLDSGAGPSTSPPKCGIRRSPVAVAVARSDSRRHPDSSHGHGVGRVHLEPVTSSRPRRACGSCAREAAIPPGRSPGFRRRSSGPIARQGSYASRKTGRSRRRLSSITAMVGPDCTSAEFSEHSSMWTHATGSRSRRGHDSVGPAARHRSNPGLVERCVVCPHRRAAFIRKCALPPVDRASWSGCRRVPRSALRQLLNWQFSRGETPPDGSADRLESAVGESTGRATPSPPASTAVFPPAGRRFSRGLSPDAAFPHHSARDFTL